MILEYKSIFLHSTGMFRWISRCGSAAFASVASIALVGLSACSNPMAEPGQGGAGGGSDSSLPSELPSKYKAWPRQRMEVTACSFDPARPKPDESLDVTGWGVIEASAGVVPEAFILEINKNGSNYYLEVDKVDRDDIASRLDNPALLRSGFKYNLSLKSISAPFTATMLMAFDNRIFPCQYRLQLQ